MDESDCNKRRKSECGSVDRISELPDEIIYIILSSLPLRQATATSLLSHRWHHLWKHTSNLDFYDPTKVFPIACHGVRRSATISSFTSHVHLSGDLEILRIRGCTFGKFVIEISAPRLYEVVANAYEVVSDAKPGALRFKNVPRLAIASLVDGVDDGSLVVLNCRVLSREVLPYMPNLKELYVVVSRSMRTTVLCRSERNPFAQKEEATSLGVLQYQFEALSIEHGFMSLV
ncbi:hypothetical protein SASPL_121441 [Salvia splendens]|uniref:F-box domain-containing protein n=1 Tax=Salvia splendens TaxID=180675 RepID=A0A8X8XW30_SALSN|nr:hypothetical protein SASPL_121441 [Salvia splendens]